MEEISKYAWVFSVASIVLVFIGWRVVYGNAKRLATRSESKSLIDATSKLVNEISDLSIEYWLRKSKETSGAKTKSGHIKGSSKATASNESMLYVMNIMAKISQASRYIEILKKRGLELDDKHLAMICEKATLDCETASRLSISSCALRAHETMAACLDTLASMYGSFENCHPPSQEYSVITTIKEKLEKMDQWHAERDFLLVKENRSPR
ncbi:hypothetical protein [Serratia odorifera]|uniref:Uncharacterized protein n=2 Tax=Serratia odorifera TaxID=618 RepID=D4DVX5_SEROD|nr:hypothetical protein [Serratia odorifera]EFE98278.1 hypothetical protein HMPREF0758_0075 [Serratia odorifera DSM 4582]PNK92670.1 hypothetical protein CEQ31_025000 [Serratia odorifera]RII73861.1 hypothetical protein DX901_01525 [Serratia odorifera]VDZ51587.1 Uncharacterised protein [Serratia odorifera]